EPMDPRPNTSTRRAVLKAYARRLQKAYEQSENEKLRAFLSDLAAESDISLPASQSQSLPATPDPVVEMIPETPEEQITRGTPEAESSDNDIYWKRMDEMSPLWTDSEDEESSNYNIGDQLDRIFGKPGLSSRKWINTTDSIKIAHLDILILVETWFVDQDKQSSFPWTFISSKKINNKNNNINRETSGILVLMNPNLKNKVSKTEITEYSVKFTLLNTTIMAVYFPPKMKIKEIRTYLPKEQVSLLIGDINTFFGAQFGSKKNAPEDRIKEFKSLEQKLSLVHLKPCPLLQTPDHAFVLTGIKAT
ncbi:hypothetical protein BB559_006728, partial [Furculomyces boomerangus]